MTAKGLPKMCNQSCLSRLAVLYFVLCVLSSFITLSVTFGQEKLPPATGNVVHEFPMILENNIVAGKTAIGTKIQAKLCVATLANGIVIPRNAVFSGEVTESMAKTANSPSRLTILMKSVQWKNGSAVIKAYLTPWYYPTLNQASSQNLQYGPTQPANRTWNGEGQYPDPNSKVYRPFPSGDEDKSGAAPDATTSVISSRRVPIKDVESEPSNNGGITIVSRKGNIKLDKTTTYVLATAEFQFVPAKLDAAK
jgi:hypothetical protein